VAIVADFLLATLSRTVFVKPPDPIRNLTAMPRAIVNYNILNGVVSAKPLNDQAELTISFLLDPTFAYKMVDMSISLSQDRANDWANRAYFEFTNAIRNLEQGATERHVVVLEDLNQIPGSTEMWIARTAATHNLPRYVIQVPPGAAAGTSPVTTFKANNQNVAAALAGTVNFYVTFFEYEIEQAEQFPLHWPTQVYER